MLGRTTTYLHTTNNVYRSSANNVVWGGGGEVYGDYYYLWSTNITSTTYVGSTQIHTGTVNGSPGDAADIVWYDHPSSLGPGTYSVTDSWQFSSSCGSQYYGPTTSYDSIPLPSFTQSNAGNAIPQTLWNLGPGTADSIATSDGYTYYQSITLTVSTNCGSGDTCNDTPTWSIYSPSNTLQLSSTSGSSVTLSKGSSMGNCTADTPISVSLGGFSSASVTFTTNSPSAAIARSDLTGDYAEQTGDLSPGYQTINPFSVVDVCPGGGDLLTTLPWYEAFGTWSGPGVISGWNVYPSPTTSSTFNDPDDPHVFVDYIGAQDTTMTWNPEPTFTVQYAPYTYNTTISDAPHSYYVGAGGGSTYSGGVNVFSGKIYYFQDHGYTY